MQPATKKLRSPFKTFGGKSYLARRIVSRIPPHEVYLEPFAGGLSILLNKPPAEVEIAGDLNADLIRAWRTIQLVPSVLRECLREIPYSREVFEGAEVGSPDDVEHTIAYLIRSRMSRSGLGKAFSWSDRLRGGQPEGPNAWATAIASLPDVARRVAGVEFVNSPASNTILTYGWNERAVAVLDPPYVHATRTVTEAYDWEMTAREHVDLLELLIACPAKILLCGYDNEIYNSMLGGWEVARWDIANHSGQTRTKQRRTECLWMKL